METEEPLHKAEIAKSDRSQQNSSGDDSPQVQPYPT